MIKLTRYRVIVLIGYFFLVPLLILKSPIPVDFKVSFSDILPLLISLLVSIILFLPINKLLSYGYLQHKKITSAHLLLILCYSLAFAVPEEIIFRGIIQGYFSQSLSPVFAIISSALIFGIAHLPNSAKGYKIYNWNWKFAFITFLLGLPLGWLYYVTQSITMPIVLHTFYILLFKGFYQNKA